MNDKIFESIEFICASQCNFYFVIHLLNSNDEIDITLRCTNGHQNLDQMNWASMFLFGRIVSFLKKLAFKSIPEQRDLFYDFTKKNQENLREIKVKKVF
jgi:hypothetical protein